jgi:hypothetical protein
MRQPKAWQARRAVSALEEGEKAAFINQPKVDIDGWYQAIKVWITVVSCDCISCHTHPLARENVQSNGMEAGLS